MHPIDGWRRFLVIAPLAVMLVSGCAGQGDATVRERLCGETNASLAALAREIGEYDGESGLNVFGPRLNTLESDLGSLRVEGDVATARDEAITALRQMQEASQNQSLDSTDIDATSGALAQLDSALCA